MTWFLVLVVALCSGKAKPAPPTVPVKGSALVLEIADDDSLRAHGLSDRRSMPWDRGMLFVFPDEQRRVFWMIDCSFDLDVAFLDRAGVIRDIQTMPIEPGVAPDDLRRYTSRSDRVKYALEVNRGWMSAHGVRVGDSIPGVRRWNTRR